MAQAQTGSRGHVLLSNDRVLSGEIVATTDSIIVRREEGSEIRLPKHQIVAANETIEDLFRARQQWLQRQPGTTTTRQKLDDARWCMDHQFAAMAKQLLAEASMADPQNPLVTSYQQRLNPASPSARGSAAEISRVSFEQAVMPEQAVAPEIVKEIDPWTLQTFSSRVQPILLAKCGSCHDAMRCGEDSPIVWRLEMPVHGNRPSNRVTKSNLDATLAMVTPGRDESSELLIQAISPHGAMNTAVLQEQYDGRLIATLKTWVRGIPEDTVMTPVQKKLTVTSSSIPPLSPVPQRTKTTEVRRLPSVAPTPPLEAFNRQTELLQSIDWP